MKKILFITGLMLIIAFACRGPLAKQETSANLSEVKTDNSKPVGMTHMEDAKAQKEDIKIEPVQGGITVAELFANRKDYSGKTVKIKGKITKVNTAIMGKNWIHLQDGTGADGQYDLTITADFVPEVGSIITIEGKIALDKDFGYGYTYPVLMEEARLIQ